MLIRIAVFFAGQSIASAERKNWRRRNKKGERVNVNHAM